jgi:hypothetical protein
LGRLRFGAGTGENLEMSAESRALNRGKTTIEQALEKSEERFRRVVEA